MQTVNKSASYRFEKIINIIILFFMTGAFVKVLLETGQSRVVTIINFVYLMVYALSFIGIFHKKMSNKGLRITSNTVMPLLLLVFLCLVSLKWSPAASYTLDKSVMLLGTTIYGIFLSVTYSEEEIFQMLLWVAALGAFSSLLYMMLFPEFGLFYDERFTAWRAFYSHKNELGRFMALGIITVLFYMQSGKRHSKILGSIAMVPMVINLYFSKSTTAMVVLIIACVIMVYLRVRKKNNVMKPLYLFFAVYLLYMFYGIDNNNNFFNEIMVSLLNRDLTFTGRSQLWYLAMEMVKLKPLFGYGFYGFWLGMEGPSGAILSRIDWLAPHAHNGFIDLALQIGLVGTVLYIIILLSQMRKRAMGDTGGVSKVRFSFIFFCFILFYNLAENILLVPNSIFWVIQVAYFARAFKVPNLRQKAAALV